jgi:rubrerythrin
VLERAIAFEEGAYRFYEEALERSAMSETSELLKKLLAGELLHRMKLEELQRTGGTSALTVPFPRGAPEIEELSEEWPPLSPWAHKGEVLQTALRKEVGAYRFYKRLADRAGLKNVRDVFAALSDEESAHAEWLKEEIRKVSR